MKNGSDARPVLLFVGRVSKEKGLDDFLRLDGPGTKVVVLTMHRETELAVRAFRAPRSRRLSCPEWAVH